MLITADHGNCEQMFDPASNQVHTQHIYRQGATGLCRTLPYSGATAVCWRHRADLCWLAMGLPQPAEMTGRSLLVA